ncbi:MAG: hypothetical protein KKD44_28490 [Proteobacteria bacterium]|nr:hypothetical protein [Pseudomonadota bacterium]
MVVLRRGGHTLILIVGDQLTGHILDLVQMTYVICFLSCERLPTSSLVLIILNFVVGSCVNALMVRQFQRIRVQRWSYRSLATSLRVYLRSLRQIWSRLDQLITGHVLTPRIGEQRTRLLQS